MAGETEEQPIRHDFQAGSFHSGSISFGRFESEILCWERWSSFSHNRYLEEVEKYSKPGSVTEKKAYFEAHFRKRGILPLSSPSEIKYQTSENDITEKTDYDEEINHINAVYGTSTCEAQFEPSCDSTDDTYCIPERSNVDESNHSKLGSLSGIELKENLYDKESNLDTSHVSNVTIGGPSNDDHATGKSQRGSSSKEKIQSQAEYTMPKSALRVSVAQSTRYISKNSSKGSEEKTKKTVNNKTSEAYAKDKRRMHGTPKSECGSKAKGDHDIKRSEKISRNGRIEESQSSTLRKVSRRVHQRENRINSAAGMPEARVKQDSSRFGFKCNARAERRKEEKAEAEEIKQLRKSLNFKATPLPSFYRGALRVSDRNKDKLSKQVCNDKLQTSCTVGTSCHSTVTSDSSPSSPCAVISKSQPCRQAVINSTLVGVGRKNENEKDTCTSLHKHKGPEVKKMTDGKQKKRGDRTDYPRAFW